MAKKRSITSNSLRAIYGLNKMRTKESVRREINLLKRKNRDVLIDLYRDLYAGSRNRRSLTWRVHLAHKKKTSGTYPLSNWKLIGKFNTKAEALRFKRGLK